MSRQNDNQPAWLREELDHDSPAAAMKTPLSVNVGATAESSDLESAPEASGQQQQHP